MFSALKYLMKELGLKSGDWTVLSDKDKADLKEWAEEEAKVLGITSNA